MKLSPASDYASTGTVFAQTARGIFKSTDGGKSFGPITVVAANGAKQTNTLGLALAPDYAERGPNRTVFVAVFQVFMEGKQGHSAGGVFRTTDGGSTWTRLSAPTTLDHGATALAVAPDGRMFAGYAGSDGTTGLLCSADGGTWEAACPAIGTVGAGGRGASTTAAPCRASACTYAPANGVAGAGPSTPRAGGPGTAASDGAPSKTVAASPDTRRTLGPVPVIAAGAGGLLLAGFLAVALRRRRRGLVGRSDDRGAL
jgi:hypothetical protein